jgi:hypothetical protein
MEFRRDEEQSCPLGALSGFSDLASVMVIIQRLAGMHLYSPLVTIYQQDYQVVLSLSIVVLQYRTHCCLDRADSEFPP